MRELATHPDVTFVLIFENKGEVVGVSNPHPHCQIYATNFTFKYIETELAAGRRHLEDTGRVAVPGHPRRPSSRTDGASSSQHGSAIAFVPYFARYAYETYVAPLRSVPTIAELDASERRDLATVLRDVVIRFDNLWQMPFPYVMALHQAPVKERRRRLSLPHRVPSAAAPAEPAEIPGRPGNRRRQLPQRHVTGGEGGRARRCRRAALSFGSGRVALTASRSIRCSSRFRPCIAASDDDVVEACEAAAVPRCRTSRTTKRATRSTRSIASPSTCSSRKSAGRSPRRDAPVVLVAEGLPGGEVVVPAGADRAARAMGRSSWIPSTARAA